MLVIVGVVADVSNAAFFLITLEQDRISKVGHGGNFNFGGTIWGLIDKAPLILYTVYCFQLSGSKV